jgi:hypothetical protein
MAAAPNVPPVLRFDATGSTQNKDAHACRGIDGAIRFDFHCHRRPILRILATREKEHAQG